MKFIATKATGQFQIHLADARSAKPGEDVGTREGEPVISATAVDEDEDRRSLDFFASDALDDKEVKEFRRLLDKLGAHAVRQLK